MGADNHNYPRTSDSLPRRLWHLLRHNSAQQLRRRAGAKPNRPDRRFYDCTERSDSLRRGRTDLRHRGPSTALPHCEHPAQPQDAEYSGMEFQRSAGDKPESCFSDWLRGKSQRSPAPTPGHQSAAFGRWMGTRMPDYAESQCEFRVRAGRPAVQRQVPHFHRSQPVRISTYADNVISIIRFMTTYVLIRT